MPGRADSARNSPAHPDSAHAGPSRTQSPDRTQSETTADRRDASAARTSQPNRPDQPTQPDQPAQVDRRTGLGRRASFVERGTERLNQTPENSGHETTKADSTVAETVTAETVTAEATGLERRRGPGRRRTDYTKSAEEGEMTSEQFLFVRAIDAFKVANNKMYPTWTDVLEVVRLLGYRKTTTSELKIRGAEDFTEKPDAPTGVRAKAGHPEAAHGATGMPRDTGITRERRAA